MDDVKEKDLFSLDALDDIPKTLRGELNALKRDANEEKIIDLFIKAGRELNLDEVLVGFYRLYNEEKDRRYMTTKLYNMARSSNSAIESVEGRKGVYKLKEDFNRDL